MSKSNDYINGSISQPSAVLWVRWVLGNTVAGVIGGLRGMFFTFCALLIGLIGIGFVAGFVAGRAQVAALKYSIPVRILPSFRKDWEMATTLGGGFAFILFLAILFVPSIVYPPLYRSLGWLMGFEFFATLAGGL